jgi:hypothetical protein
MSHGDFNKGQQTNWIDGYFSYSVVGILELERVCLELAPKDAALAICVQLTLRQTTAMLKSLQVWNKDLSLTTLA